MSVNKRAFKIQSQCSCHVGPQKQNHAWDREEEGEKVEDRWAYLRPARLREPEIRTCVELGQRLPQSLVMMTLSVL